MFKIFVTVDKHLRFKSFSQKTFIRLEHSPSNSKNSYVNKSDEKSRYKMSTVH